LVLASLNGCSFIAKVDARYQAEIAKKKGFFYGKEITSLSWTPSGKELLFTLGDGERSNIYRIKADGTELVQLTKDKAYDWKPVISADGASIVFGSRNDNESVPHVYVMDADGQNKHALTTGTVADAHPVFSPDGKTIYFLRAGWFGQASPLVSAHWWDFKVYSIGRDGTGLRQVSDHKFNVASGLDINAAGDMLLVEDYYDFKTPFWLIPVQAPERLAPVRLNLKARDLELGAPRFTPDGRSLTFKWRDGLFVADLKTGETHLMRNIERQLVFDPTLSPDGELFAFRSWDIGSMPQKDTPQICMMDSIGLNPRKKDNMVCLAFPYIHVLPGAGASPVAIPYIPQFR
jgi:Tol biopolymer transport system component